MNVEPEFESKYLEEAPGGIDNPSSVSTIAKTLLDQWGRAMHSAEEAANGMRELVRPVLLDAIDRAIQGGADEPKSQKARWSHPSASAAADMLTLLFGPDAKKCFDAPKDKPKYLCVASHWSFWHEQVANPENPILYQAQGLINFVRMLAGIQNDESEPVAEESTEGAVS